MSKPTYDLAVGYRMCPRISNNCHLFEANEKLELSEICLKSFMESIGDLKVKVIAILDNCPEEYVNIFKKHVPSENLEIVEIDCKSNRGSFLRQIEILLGQGYSDNIFFLEDDYLFLPNSLPNIVNYLVENNVDFVTPYHHRDFFTEPLFQTKRKYFEHKEYIWQEVMATCGTFLTTKKVLKETQDQFAMLGIPGTSDIQIFLRLTKTNMFNFSLFMKLAFLAIKTRFVFLMRYLGFFNEKLRSYHGLSVFIQAWFKGNGWRHVLFGKRYKLHAPTFSVSTHVSRKYLSPNIDWIQRIQSICKNLGIKKDLSMPKNKDLYFDI